MSGIFGEPVRVPWRRLDWPGWARRAVTGSSLALATGALLAPGSAFEDADRLFAHQDKVVHLALFATLALLVRWSLPGGPGGRGARGAALAGLALYAASIETLQPLLTAGQRLFEWGDLAANAFGTCAGWLLFGAAVARAARRRPAAAVR